MKSFHLDFSQLSDLIDGDLSEETAKAYMVHISSCSECKIEYDRISQCLNLLHELKNKELQIPDLCSSTMALHQSRHRKRLLMRRIPAVAASFFIIFGAAYTLRGYIDFDGSQMVATEDQMSRTEKIISHLRSYNATITRMTDKYVYGKISQKQLTGLQKELAKGNFPIEILKQPYYEVSNLHKKNYEEASLGTGNKKLNIRRVAQNSDGKLVIRISK